MFGLGQNRVDAACMEAAGLSLKSKLDEATSRFVGERRIDVVDIDDSVRRLIESQMFMLSLSTSLLNGCLTDAYYEAGKADPLSGLPRNLKVDHDLSRAALRLSWSQFGPITRANLDTRYRYVLVSKLMSPGEAGLWAQMEAWSETAADKHFRLHQPLRLGWLDFIEALGRGDKEGAVAALRDHGR